MGMGAELSDEPVGSIPCAFVRVSILIEDAKKLKIPLKNYAVIAGFKRLGLLYGTKKELLGEEEILLLDRVKKPPTLKEVLSRVQNLPVEHQHTATLFLLGRSEEFGLVLAWSNESIN